MKEVGQKTSVAIGFSLPPVQMGSIQLEDEEGRGPGLFLKATKLGGVSGVGVGSVDFSARLSVKVMPNSEAGQPELDAVFFKGELSTIASVPPAIGGSLAMVGTWTKIFGIDYLHASDLKLGMQVTMTWPPLPQKIEIGGELCIGREAACYSSTPVQRPEVIADPAPVSVPAIPSDSGVAASSVRSTQVLIGCL